MGHEDPKTPSPEDKEEDKVDVGVSDADFEIAFDLQTEIQQINSRHQ